MIMALNQAKFTNSSSFLSDNNLLAEGSGEILYSIKQEERAISVIKFTNIDENSRNKIIKIMF
ncbi:MAG: hypothetical protein MZV64_27780 [Ignavibacteriales bacterium]|nr:hypothetical protein [Ignavibacteriales bacterium]